MKVPPNEAILPASPISRQPLMSLPRTSLGKWSLGLAAVFVTLLCAFFAVGAAFGGFEKVARLPMSQRTISFSNPHVWLTLTLSLAAISAFAGAIAAILAIRQRAERSILVLFPMLVAILTLFFSIGEIAEIAGY